MTKATSAQRERRRALEAVADVPLAQAAHTAWAVAVERRREELAAAIRRLLGKEPDSFPEPLKGYQVVAEVETLVFDRDRQGLCLVVTCPVCAEPHRSSVEVQGLSVHERLGQLLASADVDSRCDACVTEMREES